MATLVTGGTGFIGSNVVKALAQRGRKVICFDLAPPDDLVKKYLAPWTEQVVFIQGDVLDKSNLEQLASHDITRIVHAAVFTGVLPEVEAGRSYSIVAINVMGTTNMLELACRLPTERFLYVSSGSVYGEGQDPTEVLYEDSPLNPRSLYGATKYTSELLTRRYGELHGFQTVSVRLGGPYGPMERVTNHRANQSIIKEWTGKALRGEPINVSNRSIRRQVTHVSDIADGICTVLEAPTLSYDVYNNSCPQLNTLEEIIEVLHELRPGLQVTDLPSSVVGEVDLGAASRGRENRLDVTRLKEDLGFVAHLDLASGLRDYMTWRETYHYTD